MRLWPQRCRKKGRRPSVSLFAKDRYGLRPRAGKGEAPMPVPAGAVSPVFRAKQNSHDDMNARRVQTRACRAPLWAGDPPPLRPPLPLLPRSRRRAGLQRSAAL